jgi:hypothetical protein
MSLQTIINISDQIEINRRRVVGIMYTRNEIIRTAETPTRNPWKITVRATSSLKYSDARKVLETIDHLDRSTPSIISFSSLTNFAWMFMYQGDLTAEQRAATTVLSFTGNQLRLQLPSNTYSSTTKIFAAGDIVQITNYPYPMTIVNDVFGVAVDNSSRVTVTTHRGNFMGNNVIGQTLNWGNDVQFKVVCVNMPTYKLLPGAYTVLNGVVINNARIEWSDNFSLVEYVG